MNTLGDNELAISFDGKGLKISQGDGDFYISLPSGDWMRATSLLEVMWAVSHYFRDECPGPFLGCPLCRAIEAGKENADGA